ncbi:hypothetical protein KAJ61_02140 [Candidatus Parcubacteria bacterium]|nr:hypothetical protein [Candidatus Parcubacteria bacterium]
MLNLLYFIESLFFIYISWLSGWLVIAWLKISFKSKIKKFSYPLILGYGILGNLGLILSLLAIYKSYYVYLYFFLIIALGRKKFLKHIKFLISKKILIELNLFFKNFFKDCAILKIIILFWLFAYLTIAFTPWSMGFDGLAYHLPFAVETVESGSISFPVKNSLSYGHLPLFTEIFYGLSILIFKNFIVLKIIQFSAFILLALVLADFSLKYLKNKKFTFLFLVLMLANMPLVKSSLGGGFIDIFTFLFGITSVIIIIELLLSRKTKNEEKKLLITSGALLGLALSTKYLALFFVLINYGFLFFFCFSKKMNIKNILKNILFYSLPAALLCGFWYIKNLIYTGDPFFPIFSEASTLKQAIEHFVLERKILNFFAFPFAFWGIDSILKLPYALLNAFYFASIYLMGLFLIFKQKITKLEIILFIFIQSYLGLLFYWSHQIRFAIPALIISSLLLIFLLEKTINFTVNKYKINISLADKIINRMTCFISIILLLASLNVFAGNFSCIQSSKNTVCMAKTAGSTIYAVNYINQNIKNEKIIEYWNPFYKFSLNNNNQFQNNFCLNDLQNNNSGETIKKCFKNNDIKYLLDDTNSKQSNANFPNINNAKYKIAVTEFFIKKADIIYEYFDEPRDSYIRLYKLK